MLSNTATPKYYGQFRDAVMQALQNMCNEFEWRLNVLCDRTGFDQLEISDALS